jgi:hypothetical protein
MIKYSTPDENEQKPTLCELNATYSQGADCVSDRNEPNFLNIEIQEGGGGVYFVIKTERWAFDSVEELIKIVNDFKSKFKEE